MEYKYPNLLLLCCCFVSIFVLSFYIFYPTGAHSLLCLDKWFVQIYLNVSWDLGLGVMCELTLIQFSFHVLLHLPIRDELPILDQDRMGDL